MLLIVIAFVGGAFTVLSPCILPVVPFVFARSEEPFLTGRLPMLLGLALTFALLTGLGAAGLNGAAQLSEYGRWIALGLFALFGAALLFPALATRLSGPLTALADRFMARSQDDGASRRIGSAVLLGAATGLLWAPCAGPILGVILTGAMLQGANAQTSLLLLAYGAGSALSLGTLIFAGRGLVNRLKSSIPFTGWFRRGAGVAVLAAAAVIATGADKSLLAGTSSEGVASVEKSVLENAPKVVDYFISKVRADSTMDEGSKGAMPSLAGAVQWLNSPELSAEALRGKVVLVDFWTYDCINCQHTLPYVKAWEKKYGKDGLVVIGVHTPEYGYERIIDNVREQVRKLGITYPVAIDNNYAIWRHFDNQYWPAHYLIDVKGQVRYSHFGEGSYEAQEHMIRQLLQEAQAPAA